MLHSNDTMSNTHTAGYVYATPKQRAREYEEQGMRDEE